MMLVPQKPYMALGSLRQQLLYPVFDAAIISEALDDNDEAYAKQGLLDFPVKPHVGGGDGNGNGAAEGADTAGGADGGTAASGAPPPTPTAPPVPGDAVLLDTLSRVRRPSHTR